MIGAGQRQLTGEETPSWRPSLERFVEELAEIAPKSGGAISADSHLVDDLGFDASSVARLSLLLYRRYGIGGLSDAALADRNHLTAETFFRRCVLDVLGYDPADR
jgi:hypothetical protein